MWSVWDFTCFDENCDGVMCQMHRGGGQREMITVRYYSSLNMHATRAPQHAGPFFVPYSRKLLREKTFEALWLFAKVFSTEFGGVVSFGSTSDQSAEVFPTLGKM